MPDFDNGHIYLTTLAPIKGCCAATSSANAYIQNIRNALARLPTALQSPATEAIGINSPFSKNKRTHLARLFVLNDSIYNGRTPIDAIWAALFKKNPLAPQQVDRLNAAYLVFCADFDAISEDGAPLPQNLSESAQKQIRRDYAKQLWLDMSAELNDLYQNCVGFDTVRTADDFADYLERCHVETTMPFHDYYLNLPKFHLLPIKTLGLVVGVPALFTFLSLIFALIGVDPWPWLGWSSFWSFIGGSCVTAIAAYGAIRYTNYNGNKPIPPGEYDDLPSVLKALYLQQNFTDFVVAQQGQEAEQLYKAFGDFIATHQPDNKMAPSQAAGVISAKSAGNTPHKQADTADIPVQENLSARLSAE